MLKIPRAVRPKRTEIMTMAVWLEDDSYLSMSVEELVANCMSWSGGGLNPIALKEKWTELKDEAGVK